MNPKFTLSDKQTNSIKTSTERINVWEGSVRSGKTFSSIIRFAMELRNGPPGHAMIVGPSRDSIQRNVIYELCHLLNLPVPTPKSSSIGLFGRTVHLVGASDERAQRRIQGSTLAMAYADEATLIPQNFFKMLLSRLSVTDAKLFATTNPDSPFHWLKTEFLDNVNLDLSRHFFTIEDNPSLSTKYIDSLKREYQGLWYQRYIEGKWVLADGTVYDFFTESEHVMDFPPAIADYYIVGVDYGTSNPTVFSLIAYSHKAYPNIWVEKEYYYDSRKEMRQKTDTDYAEDLKEFIANKNIKAIYIDPSAASFRAELYNQGVDHVYDAENDVLNGIRFVSKMLANGSVKVCRGAKETIREFGTYVWDTKAGERGEDKPVKDHDHSLDALRYALYSHFGTNESKDVSAAELDAMYMKAMMGNRLPEPFVQPSAQGGAFNYAYTG